VLKRVMLVQKLVCMVYNFVTKIKADCEYIRVICHQGTAMCFHCGSKIVATTNSKIISRKKYLCHGG
jgi:hypothetical protein